MSSETELNQYLTSLMMDNYQLNNLKNIDAQEFEETILGKLNKINLTSEGYKDTSKQRDMSLKFYWGHYHHFGTFAIPGIMEERHIEIITYLVNDFGLPLDLTGKKILDIGVWTGGTSLLLAAMGATVTACEEVKMYSDTVNYMAHAFDIENQLKCDNTSLYSIDYHDEFDYVLYLGVIYHVTDPVLSLRILYNALKDGGDIFAETFGLDTKGENSPLCAIQGGPANSGKVEHLNRTGWNYFIPSYSGFEKWLETVGFKNLEVVPLTSDNRLRAKGTRIKHEDMLRAGLSRPDIR
ncbi:MAG: DUF1698 domain-containing protein [Rhodospirillales bacterium]|jgi:2-polyprenyl-3-methyl-5-hydroxy-6-metoxy-1,4-benzoquinol methylase|nr:DUF1698 domain-containing protein [Rhodospirillales bacterium]